MLPIEAIRWTSRAEVCDTLVQFLRDTPRSPLPPDHPQRCYFRSHRSEAASLLASLSDAALAPLFREHLLSEREEHTVRVEALRTLREWRVPLPAAELEQLLADRALRGEECCFLFDHEFLPLCGSEEGQS